MADNQTLAENGVGIIRECFVEYRRDGKYSAMGWMFWNLAIIRKTDVQAAEIEELWNSLSKREQRLCEQV